MDPDCRCLILLSYPQLEADEVLCSFVYCPVSRWYRLVDEEAGPWRVLLRARGHHELELISTRVVCCYIRGRMS